MPSSLSSAKKKKTSKSSRTPSKSKKSSSIATSDDSGLTHAQKLALRVKEMHAPAKSYDPEDEDFFGGARLDTAPVDESEEEERTVLKSTLRSGIDIEALGESYKGAVTSRKQLEEDSDVAFSDDDMTDGEREAASAALERALGSMEYSDDDDDNDDDDEDENEEGDSGEGEEDSDSDSDSEGNLMERLGHDESMLNAEQKALRAQLAALADEEDTEIFRKKAAEDDIAKAKCVKNQHTLSEQNMDLRIRLQGPLSVANRLPQYDMHSEFVSNSKSVKKAFKKASKSTSALLVDLLEAQTKMMEVNPILGEPAVYEPRYKKSEKRKKSSGSETEEDKAGVLDLDHVWDHISSVQSRMEPLYKDVIDQWNRRTQLSSGSQNATSKRFKAINQSIVSQINTLLADEDELVHRSQTKRTTDKIFGKGSQEQHEQQMQAILEGKVEEYDTEIYDDTDFYQVLLKDIISSGYDHGGDAEDTLLAELRSNKNRKKKVVDRRASKGRKIRYVPIPELANFMVPIVKHDEDYMVDELYATLFGKAKQQS